MNLRFAPVDFESGESWVDKIVAAGFDGSRAAVVASLGVTQYITPDATLETMQSVARFAAGTTLVCSFMLPAGLAEPVEFETRAATEAGASRRGHPWISSFTPDEFLAIAKRAGFDSVRHVSVEDLTQLYFAGRADGLRPSSSEHLIVATT